MSSFIVLKFGGTSVSTRGCWENIHAVLNEYIASDNTCLLVCSAPSQVSNLLEAALEQALSNNHKKTLDGIHQKYNELVTELNIANTSVVAEHIKQLDETLLGISLLKESTPRIQAQVMAFGELLLSRIGALFLQQAGLDITWLDARQHLHSVSMDDDPYQCYMSTACQGAASPEFQKFLNDQPQHAFITQGFIASNDEGDTVLLGRGGSDTSAAYFASKLGALRCEIWTDVPGIYTADPRLIPSARMIKQLDYEEAQEISALGGKILHPQSLMPLAGQQIPLYIKYTKDPSRQGTLIGPQNNTDMVQIKAIQLRRSIRLISIDTVRMWQQVGFLSDIFALFKQYHISIDLVSTSESNLTVSLDDTHASQDEHVIETLLAELNKHGDARLIGPCVAISIIGRNIRTNLHRLSQMFEIFKDKHVYLLSQAANDLNLSFVVDEDEAERLANKIHQLLIEQTASECFLDKTWAQEFGATQKHAAPWWLTRREKLLEIAKQHTPHYVYDLDTVALRAKALTACKNIDHIFYSIKANHQLPILNVLVEHGIGLECVSIEELQYICEHFPNLDKNKILFTPNFAAQHEYKTALALGVHVTVDNSYPLLTWPELFRGQSIFLRIDCAEAGGHHRYVCTAGSDSKFGIPLNEVKLIKPAIQKANIKVTGLHAHSGSGILTSDNWQANAKALSALLASFPDVTLLDLGGGLGIVEKPGQSPLDVTAVDESLNIIKEAYPNIKLCLEPGRYFAAEAGIILASVTQLKDKAHHHYVGINTGMNALIRPALYGSYHEIVNLTKYHDAATELTTIVGPICESADVLGYSRLLPHCEEGDIILIATAGAYGEVMSSNYNMRACPEAVFLGHHKTTTSRNSHESIS